MHKQTHTHTHTDLNVNVLHVMKFTQFDCLLLSADPPEPEDSSKQGVSISAAPVYSELWFILLLAMLGLFLLAILLGLVMQRYGDTIKQKIY